MRGQGLSEEVVESRERWKLCEELLKSGNSGEDKEEKLLSPCQLSFYLYSVLVKQPITNRKPMVLLRHSIPVAIITC
jgi:hypothetical protein